MRKWQVGFVLGALMAMFGMAQITVPNTFVTGTTISSSAMNANFDEIESKALNRTGGTLTGNLSANSGVTIDGRDISADLDQAVKTTSSPTFVAATLSAGPLTVNGVGIVNSSGKIPALNSTYLGSLDGSALTNVGGYPAWTSVSFNAGDFTAQSGNWTLASGDQSVFAYSVSGKTMTVSFTFLTTTVSATPTYLRVVIPGSYTAAKSLVNLIGVNENVGQSIGFANVVAGQTYIQFTKLDTATFATLTDTTGVYGTISFEVQ